MKSLSIAMGMSTVLWFHSAARAQQPEAPVPSAQTAPAPPAAVPAPPPQAAPPPPYGPPPGYTVPQAGYGAPPPYYQQPPRYQPYYAYPPPPVAGGLHHRPLTIAAGLGLGTLSLRSDAADSSWAGLSYGVRLGFGLTRRWLLLLDFGGATTSTTDSTMSLTSWSFGTQVFLTNALYLKGGLGYANFTEDFVDEGLSLNGRAASLGAGVELLQGRFSSLAIEWTGTYAHFPASNRFGAETWVQNGFNLVASFF